MTMRTSAARRRPAPSGCIATTTEHRFQQEASMWKTASVLASAWVLTACASLSQLSNEVSTYSLWPAGRQPASYVFERLPSQQANPQDAELLENAAARALEQAGFKP